MTMPLGDSDVLLKVGDLRCMPVVLIRTERACHLSGELFRNNSSDPTPATFSFRLGLKWKKFDLSITCLDTTVPRLDLQCALATFELPQKVVFVCSN